MFVKQDGVQVQKRPHGGDLLLFVAVSVQIHRISAGALTAIHATASVRKKIRRQEIPPLRTIDRYALCVVIVIFLREKRGSGNGGRRPIAPPCARAS